MHTPKIVTAVPKRRFQVGPYSIVVLGEVASGDENEYAFILATVIDGDEQPGLYVTSERAPPEAEGEGSHVLRVSMRDGSRILERSDRWNSLDTFTDEALRVVTTILDLGNEEVRRLV
jgi:hypothetical protein